MPSKILSAVAFNIPLYFMADLRHGAGHFFFFLLFAFTCTLTMSAILRTIGQASRTVQEALTPAAIFIISLVIYTGFVIPVSSMQGWMRWINYLNPIAYAYESLLVNELSGRQFPCASFVPSYANTPSSEHTCSTAGAAAGADYVLGDTILNSSYAYYRAHKWRNLGILFGFMLFFFGTYLVAAEMITAEQSKGEVLVFRRGHKEAAATDKKNAQSDEGSDGEKGNVTAQKDICHWRNVCYDITIKGQPRRLLDHVDGWVKPGTLTCLMVSRKHGKKRRKEKKIGILTTAANLLPDRVSLALVKLPCSMFSPTASPWVLSQATCWSTEAPATTLSSARPAMCSSRMFTSRRRPYGKPSGSAHNCVSRSRSARKRSTDLSKT